MWINIEFTNIIWLSGVSKVSFRGGGVGFKLICEKWAYLHAREFGGMLPLEKFFKMVQFDAFWSVFCYNFVKIVKIFIFIKI